MPSSFEALVVLVIGIAPGLLFELGLERGQVYRRTPLGDRLFRFLAWSIGIHVVALPLTVWLVRQLAASDWRRGELDVWPTLYVAGLYAVVPFLLGAYVGGERFGGPSVRRALLGRDLEPTSWEFQFGRRRRPGFVRVRMRDGVWIAGTWCYTSSHPNTPEDMLLERLDCCSTTGALVVDGEGRPAPLGWFVLLCRSDVDRIEFQPFPEQEQEESDGGSHD